MASPDPDRGRGPQVFVTDLDAPALDPHDRHHLERVRRVRAGDEITVCDGQGRWRQCRMGEPVEATGDIVFEAAPAPAVTVAFALVKGERPEWVTQKLTELGVDTIVPFVAERSVVRWDTRRVATNHERLTKVAREASMQCRRSWLPTVEPLRTFGEVAKLPGALLGHMGGGQLPHDATTVLIGPEGGWSGDELGCALPRVSLGVHVLRSDTAAIVAGTLLTAHRAGLA